MSQLHLLDEFQQALDHYHLSPAALEVLRTVPLIALVGPTGGGRNTIIDELLRSNPGKYYFTVSDTTRNPRYNNGVLEQNGREYWFRKEAEMLADIQAGKFLEAEVIHQQQVSGISIRELELARSQSKIAIADTDIGGIGNILKLKANAIAVLVLPPSFEEWQRRLSGRGGMPVDEAKRRLRTAVTIFNEGMTDSRLNLIVNNDYASAAKRLNQLASGVQIDTNEKAHAHDICRQLLADTKASLVTL